MRQFILLICLIFVVKNAFSQTQSDAILGVWQSETKDLKVEIFKQQNKYFGKLNWFYCEPKTPPMEYYKDKVNPNAALRSRPWLGMILLQNLEFDGKNEWVKGEIYDPNSGRTYSSKVRLANAQTLHVRGYFGIPLLGKTMVFSRKNF
jgi:uncharacterized protein (DUF2147 family)